MWRSSASSLRPSIHPYIPIRAIDSWMPACLPACLASKKRPHCRGWGILRNQCLCLCGTVPALSRPLAT